jgi:D-3-phosphoglycerate dehydrogenase
MSTLLVCDPIADSAVEAIRAAGIPVDVRDDVTPEALSEIIGSYEGMVVRSRTKVRAPLIDHATQMKVIIRAGVGLDNIDVRYAQDKGIDVRNTPQASTNAVTELVLAMMFALARSLVRADTTMKNGTWAKKQLTGTELAGKTLGIVGYGRIGRTLGEKARALGMTVMASDPYVEHEDIVPMTTLLPASDYVSIHVPHTTETHDLLDAEAFDMMKEGAYLIQASRGGTVNEAALFTAIESGKLAGAAMDVYSEEPPERDDLRKLVEHPRVITTPHIGAGTVEAKARIGDEVVKLAKAYLAPSA